MCNLQISFPGHFAFRGKYLQISGDIYHLDGYFNGLFLSKKFWKCVKKITFLTQFVIIFQGNFAFFFQPDDKMWWIGKSMGIFSQLEGIFSQLEVIFSQLEGVLCEFGRRKILVLLLTVLSIDMSSIFFWMCWYIIDTTMKTNQTIGGAIHFVCDKIWRHREPSNHLNLLEAPTMICAPFMAL